MLYVHVPFCRHKCVYCDFASGTNIQLAPQYLDALAVEIEHIKKNFPREIEFLKDNKTIYLGGGTPSMLSPEQLKRLIEVISEIADVQAEEFTIEANSDMLTEEYLDFLKRDTPVNRLSIGIQSLNDSELKWMQRTHTAEEAISALRRAKERGFENISVDVMYALPGQTIESLGKTLDLLLAERPNHISAYSLMYEPGSKITKIKEKPIDEELSAEMYCLIERRLAESGYQHYEISNWALPGFQSKHNSGYWDHQPYLGIGPAACSFDGERLRRANTSSLVKYLRQMSETEPFYEKEMLSDEDLFNERVMLGLRRAKGVDLEMLRRDFGDLWAEEMLKELRTYTETTEPMAEIVDGVLKLTGKGVYASDQVMAAAMRVEM